MKINLIRMMIGVFAAIVILSMPARAPAQEAPVLAPPQLDQLVAPVALYPDTLLTQILTASTYPLEVVEAARWIKDPDNARLSGEQLADALDDQDWDPSVKSLVPFPQILQLMDGNLSWMQQLGDAFLAQESDVMDSVQRLRAQALAAGTLRSTVQQVVITQGSTIIIQPATPEVVYVPAYSPAVVYGDWPYPDYPPDYFPPPAGYDYSTGIVFGIGIGVIGTLWGWESCDWDHHRVHVDHDRFNRINSFAIDHRNHPRFTDDTWDHDPHHRRGVPYRDPGTRARFLGNSTGSPDTRRDFRGFDHGQQISPTTGGAGIPSPGGQPVVGPRVPTMTSTPRPPVGNSAASPPTQIQPITPQPAIGPRVPTAAPIVTQRPQPPAFEGMTKAPEVQRQIERARTSQQFLPRSMQDRSLAPSPSAQPRSSSSPLPRSMQDASPSAAPSGGGSSSRSSGSTTGNNKDRFHR